MTMRPANGAAGGDNGSATTLPFVERDAAVSSPVGVAAPTAAAAASTKSPSTQAPPAYVHDDGGGSVHMGDEHGSGSSAAGLLSTCARIVHSDEPVLAKARLLVHTGQQHVQQQFSSLRPWSEFFDRSYFAMPAGVAESVQRLTRNVGYFYPNYIVLSLVCSSYILLINLAFSLCVVLGVFAYFGIRSLSARAAAEASSGGSGGGDGQIRVCGRVCTAVQLYVLLGLFAAISFYVTNGSSVIFWLTLTSCGVSATHAVLRRPTMAEPTFVFA